MNHSGKGFGDRPKVSPGEAARLGRICQAFLDDEPDADIRISAWVRRTTIRLGGEAAWDHWFIHHSNEDLGVEVARLYYDATMKVLPAEERTKIQSMARDCVLATLIEGGMEPGKDFSTHEGGLMLSDRATELLKGQVPEEAWEYAESKGEVKPIASNPWTKLEDHLGVPFRQRLGDRLIALVEAGHSAAIVAAWIGYIFPAVGERVAGVEGGQYLLQFLVVRLNAHSPHFAQAVLEVLKDTDLLPTEDEWIATDLNPLLDAVIAAGASEENGEIKGDGISRAGIQRLSLVWLVPDAPASPTDLLVAMDRADGG